MFKWILEHLKIIAISSLILAVWITLSAVVNLYIPWNHLTNFFTIFRWFFNAMNWINDTTTMLWAIGLSLVLEGAEWALESSLIPIKWFKSDSN